MSEYNKRRSHGRIILLSVLTIVFAAMLAPLSGYLYVGVFGDQAIAQENADSAAAWQDVNPRSQYWREVRKGTAGYSTDTQHGADTLIQASGQDWRRIRNGMVSTYGAWFLALVILGLGLFYIVRGAIKLNQDPSGRTITRWRRDERILHWVVAILFIIMAVGGLSLLFGRAVLVPILGHAGFAVWAKFSKVVHNYTGLLFTVAILLMIVMWIRDNLPRKEDWIWLRNGGGMFGRHAPAGRMNAGEKLWFWFIATAGIAVCVSGLVMDFPNFFTDRGTFQVANIIHGVLALAWIGFFLGHVYIGTLGTEGALEGMKSGDVSVEWAQQHHDAWYQETLNGQPQQVKTGATAAGEQSAPGSA